MVRPESFAGILLLSATVGACTRPSSSTPAIPAAASIPAVPRRNVVGRVRVIAQDEAGQPLPAADFETERGPPPMTRIGVAGPRPGTRDFVVPVESEEFAVRVSAGGRDAAEAVLDFRTGAAERELRLTLPRRTGPPGRIRIQLDGFVPELTLAELYSPAGFFVGSVVAESKPRSLSLEARPGSYLVEIRPDFSACVSDPTLRWYVLPSALRVPTGVKINSDRETLLPISFEEGGRFRLHLRARRSDPPAPDQRGAVECRDLDAGGEPKSLCRVEGDQFVESSFTSEETARWTTVEALRAGHHRFRIEAPGYRPFEFEAELVAGKYADVERELVER